MIHKFNKKADFELMLNMASNHLFGTLEKVWDCNSRIYLWYIKSESFKPNFIKKLTFVGYSSDVFSHRGEGLFFGDNTTIDEIRKEYSFIADKIERYMSQRTSIYEFKIGR